MTDQAQPALREPGAQHAPCKKIGHFIAKGSCFALHGEDGVDVWLDIDPVPLHMLDQKVEISGRHFGPNHLWVDRIGPAEQANPSQMLFGRA